MQRGVLSHFVVGHSDPGHLEHAITFTGLIACNEMINRYRRHDRGRNRRERFRIIGGFECT